MEGELACLSLHLQRVGRSKRSAQELEAQVPGGQGMDVKGAKALSERLAEAARNIDPPPVKAAVSKPGGSPPDSKP